MDRHCGFLVWNPEGRAPSRQHLSLDDARAEAERLAGRNPGSRFYVCAPVAVAMGERPAPVVTVSHIPPVTRIDGATLDTDLPF
jgi:hypothetical protein